MEAAGESASLSELSFPPLRWKWQSSPGRVGVRSWTIPRRKECSHGSCEDDECRVVFQPFNISQH